MNRDNPDILLQAIRREYGRRAQHEVMRKHRLPTLYPNDPIQGERSTRFAKYLPNF